MRATLLNCALKSSPEESNTESLLSHVRSALEEEGVDTTTYRLVDLNLPRGVVTDAGDGDEWPRVHSDLLSSEILVVAARTT